MVIFVIFSLSLFKKSEAVYFFKVFHCLFDIKIPHRDLQPLTCLIIIPLTEEMGVLSSKPLVPTSSLPTSRRIQKTRRLKYDQTF